jgi:hypothetical protein
VSKLVQISIDGVSVGLVPEQFKELISFIVRNADKLQAIEWWDTALIEEKGVHRISISGYEHEPQA